MASQRDFITEIDEIKSRHPNSGQRLDVFVRRMKDLRLVAKEWLSESWADEDELCRKEVLRYIPIALVAATQGWLQLAVRDLVDAGEPFAANSKSLPNVRFDHDLVIALAARKLTAGEIIAHFTSCNRVEDVFGTLNKVSGQNIPNMIQDYDFGSPPHHSLIIREHYDTLVREFTDTFRLRHIFAHELAPHETVPPETIVRRVGVCQLLISACDRAITEVLSACASKRNQNVGESSVRPLS